MLGHIIKSGFDVMFFYMSEILSVYIHVNIVSLYHLQSLTLFLQSETPM